MIYRPEDVAEYLSLQRTRSRLTGIIGYSFGLSPEDSQDVYSRAVLKIYSWSKKRGGLNLQSATLETYVYNSVFNEAKTLIRDQRRWRKIVFPLDALEEDLSGRGLGNSSNLFADESSPPDGRVIQNEFERDILDAARTLPPNYQTIIYAYFKDPSLTYEEAQELFEGHIPSGTLKVRIHRARKKMREIFREKEEVFNF